MNIHENFIIRIFANILLQFSLKILIPMKISSKRTREKREKNCHQRIFRILELSAETADAYWKL